MHNENDDSEMVKEMDVGSSVSTCDVMESRDESFSFLDSEVSSLRATCTDVNYTPERMHSQGCDSQSHEITTIEDRPEGGFNAHVS